MSVKVIRVTALLVVATAAFTATLVGAEQVGKSKVPGVVIKHIPAATQRYVGSPSIAILPDGSYVASHDVFGPGNVSDRREGATIVYVSSDKGTTWQKSSRLHQAASTLFVHRGTLYLMGLGHGSVLISRSDDSGRTWSKARDEDSGILLANSRYHTGPVPVVEHDGRIWRAMENTLGPGEWGSHFRAFMMSAPADSDLLRAENWTCSQWLGKDGSWLDKTFDGWLEGNAVVTPEGEIVNILRVHYHSYDGAKAAMIHVGKNGNTATFDPETGFIDFPGGAKKFTIRFDPVSKLYWSLSNYIPPKHKHGGQLYRAGNAESTRNTLALISSPDLRRWTIRAIVIYHPDAAKHGFQYADWQFDGDDIIAAVRTAYDDGLGGAHTMHDANYLTFHRIRGFRDLQFAAKPDAK